MNSTLHNLRQTVETILRCNLSEAIGISDKAEAEELVRQFLHAVSNQIGDQSDQTHQDSDQLSRKIDPQWIILAAGKGTRIDPSSHLNKNLDLWFGEKNTLQLSRSYLPGSRSHIIVVNAQMAARVAKTDVPSSGVLPPPHSIPKKQIDCSGQTPSCACNPNTLTAQALRYESGYPRSPNPMQNVSALLSATSRS